MAKKTIIITEHISELMYDIQNKTYLTGRSRYTGANHEEVANMQANEDDENANQIIRSIGNAFSYLKTKLAEFLVEDDTTGNNTQISAETDLVLTLMLPSNYNQATIDSVSAAVHKYIVNTAIGDWFAITNKSDAADYVTMATNNLEEIREAINKRVRPVRKAIAE